MDNSFDARVHSGQGYLIVQVSTAGGAIPLPGVIVTVRDYDPENGGDVGNVIASMVTDRSGKTPILPLPTPSRTLAQAPGSEILPYALYNVDVQTDRYYENYYANVPIFDGIVAVQPAVLQPLPDNEFTDNASYGAQIFFESQNPDL